MLRKLILYLIKPSQYDDDGYVVRHWRGVLPSNTLACLAGLTEDVVAQKRLGESLKVNIHVLDETVDRIPVKRIAVLSAAPIRKRLSAWLASKPINFLAPLISPVCFAGRVSP